MATPGNFRRVLIVEDEPLVAMHVEDLLIALGHAVVGLATRIDKALILARNGDLDFAILDVNVAGTQSFSVAGILRERGIPFVFATGYGVEGLIEGYRDELALRKPYQEEDLESVIEHALGISPLRT